MTRRHLFAGSTVLLLTGAAFDLTSFTCLGFQPRLSLVPRSRVDLGGKVPGVSDEENQQQQTSDYKSSELSRREVFSRVIATSTTAGLVAAATLTNPEPAHAVGPSKINLLNPTYSALPCPKDKPIPGEKAMKGMKGLCVTVIVDLEEAPEKELEKVGVYGFVTDEGTVSSLFSMWRMSQLDTLLFTHCLDEYVWYHRRENPSWPTIPI
jgi:hypothetical protein